MNYIEEEEKNSFMF